MAQAHNVICLAVSRREEDLAFLDHMFDDAGWKLLKARTYREALSRLRQQRVSVVLCERRLPDGDWKDVMRRIAEMRDPPRLIVVSRHANEHLWAEVGAMGGFDVLATPFDPQEAAYEIGVAWLDWNHHRKRRERAFMQVPGLV